MPVHRTDDVFGVTRDTPLNYVGRASVDDKFLENLTRDKHLVVYGSSKQGKTSLRKNCLAPDDYITVTCSNKWTINELHGAILKQAGYEVTQSTSRTLQGDAKLTASLKIMGAGIEAGGGGGASSTNVSAPLEIDPADVNDVVHALDQVNFGKYIVLEDFHYLPVETQKNFAISLKAFHENSSLCFIVVGVWLEESRLTSYNGDLTGRVVGIDADRWTDDELREVISRGEELLNVEFDEAFVADVIRSSQGSVAILQECCNRAAKAAGVHRTMDVRTPVRHADTAQLVKSVVDEQGGRYSQFLSQFAEGFQHSTLEMYRWILFAILTSSPQQLEAGLSLAQITTLLNAKHPNAPLNTGNITQALQSTANLQVTKEIRPIILDYDTTNHRLSVVDRGFLIWLTHQDRAAILAGLDLPGA